MGNFSKKKFNVFHNKSQLLASAFSGGALALSLTPASAWEAHFIPGDLIISSSIYTGTASTVTVGAPLPGGGAAMANGTYPDVFQNVTPDASFGVTSPIILKEYALSYDNKAIFFQNFLNVTNLTGIVTSFSSKSELSLNISTNGDAMTFMGYQAPVNTLDVSNSNTPDHVDPTDPVMETYARAVIQLNTNETYSVTPVDAYSGNNGRAAILDDKNGASYYYMAGNAGNGSGTQPIQIVDDTGIQITQPGVEASSPVGAIQGTQGAANGFDFGFSVAEIGDAADKSGKDTNFRGLTIFNNTLYTTKGSGSNGVDTVYQVGLAGALPSPATASSTPYSILPGFPTGLAKSIDTTPADAAFAKTDFHPFGIWFANATTLYVADEGDGVNTPANAANPNAGLEKWSLVNGTWVLDYTLQAGLDLGVQYPVENLASSLYPATDGLRNLTGKVNRDGTVTLFAVTSTISTSGDQGADPNKVVSITDRLSATTLPPEEKFTTLETAKFAEVLRGVALAPCGKHAYRWDDWSWDRDLDSASCAAQR